MQNIIIVMTIIIQDNFICRNIDSLTCSIAQNKATSSEWLQSSIPIALAEQLVNLLSVPKQRSSSSHVGVVLDKGWEKLKEGKRYKSEAVIEKVFNET